MTRVFKHNFVLLQNQKLHVENRLLREKTSDLLTENEELRQRLGLDTLDSKENVSFFSQSVRASIGTPEAQ